MIRFLPDLILRYSKTLDINILIRNINVILSEIKDYVNRLRKESILEIPFVVSGISAGNTYPLLFLSGNYIISNIDIVLDAGTATVELDINGTSVDWDSAAGVSLSLSSTITTDESSSDNTAMSGSMLSLVVSAASGAAYVAGSLKVESL